MRQIHETPYSPTVRRMRLSTALRRLRTDAGLTVTDAARAVGWPASKLTRLERGEAERPKPHDVGCLLDLYQVDDPGERETLLGYARDTRYRGWWHRYTDVFRGVLPDLEAGASAIRTYEALYVPGLLQTPEYAAAIFAPECSDEAAVDRRVAARMVRQEILARPEPPTLSVVIDEAALRKKVGGVRVMRDQLLHLATMAALAHVTIRVITDDVGAHPGMTGPFVLLDFPSPGDPRMVYLESAGTSTCLDSREEIDLYEDILDRVSALALPEDRSVMFITEQAERIAVEGSHTWMSN